MENVSTPEEILPAGDDYATVINPFTGIAGKARKGTVAATLNNIALLDRLLQKDAGSDQIRPINEAITKLISSLKVVGLFDLFNLEEWVTDEQRIGRVYVAALYLKHNPEEITERIAAKLEKIKQTTKSLVLSSELEAVISCR